MAEEAPNTRITRDDVEAVAGKLDAFMADLPEQERDVLGWILTRAQAAPDEDTAGFYQSYSASPQQLQFATPLSTQLGRSAGFGAAAGTTEVTWKYSFGRAEFGQQFIR